MRIADKGIELIKHFEGYRDVAYICAGGKWTIGYGHTQGVKGGDKVTKAQAEVFLKQDVKDAEDAVNNLISAPLTQNQFDALVSLVYNIGSGNFYNSTVRRLINEQCSDMGRIKRAFLMWKRANGITLSGLIRRREAEFELFSK